MKKIFGAVLMLALGTPMAVDAQEVDVSANGGWVSEYIFRGIPQKVSSASAGLDIGVSGLYLGTWAGDVGDGAEVDAYAGYGLEYEGFSASVGGTGYFYTGEFDETYLELNLGAGYGPLSVEYSIGQYDVEPEQDYWFLAVTLAEGGLYGTFGTFGSDFAGEYFEAGYGFTAADLDFSIAGVYSTEDLLGDDDLNLVFGVSKTFQLAP